MLDGSSATVNSVAPVPGADSTAPSLGGDWTDLGTVSVSSSATTLVAVDGGQAICLLQQTTGTSYDAAGNALSTTDANGNTTYFTYNALNEQTTAEQPTPGGTTQTVTDPAGEVTATIDGWAASRPRPMTRLGGPPRATRGRSSRAARLSKASRPTPRRVTIFTPPAGARLRLPGPTPGGQRRHASLAGAGLDVLRDHNLDGFVAHLDFFRQCLPPRADLDHGLRRRRQRHGHDRRHG